MKDEIIINELIHDMEVFGIKEKNLRNRDGLNYSILESKSIRILNRINQYLEKEGSTLQSIFEGDIEVILVKGIDAEAELEIIQSDKFFNRLHEKRLKQSNNYYENICTFLELDKEYPDYLRMDKLQKAIKEVECNEFFRSFGTEVSLI